MVLNIEIIYSQHTDLFMKQTVASHQIKQLYTVYIYTATQFDGL